MSKTFKQEMAEMDRKRFENRIKEQDSEWIAFDRKVKAEVNRSRNLAASKSERLAAAREAGISEHELIERRRREYDEQQEMREAARGAVGWALNENSSATQMPFALKLKK